MQNSAEEEFEGREDATKQENFLKLEPPVCRMRRSHTFIFIPIMTCLQLRLRHNYEPTRH